MEEIIIITNLMLDSNPAMPEIQKQLIMAMSLSIIIPTTLAYIIKELITKIHE